MVAAKIMFGQQNMYDPTRFNLAFNRTYAQWGTYEQWRKRVPEYNQYRQESRIPLKSSFSIFKDIILPKIAAAALVRGGKIGAGGKAGMTGVGKGVGETEVMENFVKKILKEMKLGHKTKYGDSPIPSIDKIARHAAEEHAKQIAAANAAAAAEKKRAETEAAQHKLVEDERDHTRGSVWHPRPHAPVQDYMPPPPTVIPDTKPTGGRGGASGGSRPIPPKHPERPRELPDQPTRAPPGTRPEGEGYPDVPEPSPETLADIPREPAHESIYETALYRKKRGH